MLATHDVKYEKMTDVDFDVGQMYLINNKELIASKICKRGVPVKFFRKNFKIFEDEDDLNIKLWK